MLDGLPRRFATTRCTLVRAVRGRGETPERAYERTWALEVIALSLKVVESRYEESGRRALFVALQPFLTGDEPSSYGDVASRLGRHR